MLMVLWTGVQGHGILGGPAVLPQPGPQGDLQRCNNHGLPALVMPAVLPSRPASCLPALPGSHLPPSRACWSPLTPFPLPVAPEVIHCVGEAVSSGISSAGHSCRVCCLLEQLASAACILPPSSRFLCKRVPSTPAPPLGPRILHLASSAACTHPLPFILLHTCVHQTQAPWRLQFSMLMRILMLV